MKRVELRVDMNGAPDEVMIDPRHMEQAVVALISNAIEASPAGGVVRIETGMDNGACWRLAVSDQGAGVPEDLRGSIFKPYFTTKADGNGIGLAVAQQVAKAHGGQLDLDNPPARRSEGKFPGSGGRGATFVLRLPRRLPEATGRLSFDE